jgi:hypothetical protein
MALSRENVIELVDNFIEVTEFEKQFLTYKEVCTLKPSDSKNIVGISWNRRSMQHNKHLLHWSQCKPR